MTNAQFPDAMKAMKPCTQLYVSIDASTKETLKKVDRPLHKDFWERFISSLEELGKKTQRTVYRLTLVKVNYSEIIGSDHLLRKLDLGFTGLARLGQIKADLYHFDG